MDEKTFTMRPIKPSDDLVRLEFNTEKDKNDFLMLVKKFLPKSEETIKKTLFIKVGLFKTVIAQARMQKKH